MPFMTNDITADQPYEAPTLQVVGTLQEITKTGALPNADGNNTANSANPFVPPPPPGS